MEFHKKLYELRKKHGISQEELADKLNVSRQTISKWELGESTPDMEKLRGLSDYFDVSLDELVMGKESVNTDKKTTIHTISPENKVVIKKILKVVGIILAVVLAIDLASMIIYFAVIGVPR